MLNVGCSVLVVPLFELKIADARAFRLRRGVRTRHGLVARATSIPFAEGWGSSSALFAFFAGAGGLGDREHLHVDLGGEEG